LSPPSWPPWLCSSSPPTPGAHACHAHTHARFPHMQLAALTPPTPTRSSPCTHASPPHAETPLRPSARMPAPSWAAPSPAPALADPHARGVTANRVPRAVRVRVRQHKPITQSPDKQTQPRCPPGSPPFARSPRHRCTPDPWSCACGTRVHRPLLPLHAHTHLDPPKQ